MRNLFLSIYGGIVASVLLVILTIYFLIQQFNETRYQQYLQQMSALSITLISNGVNRQKPQNRERWINLVSSLMAVDIMINQPNSYQQPGIIKQLQQYLIIGPYSAEQPLQVVISISSLTEKWLSATAFLALNELGHYPVEQRAQIFEQIKSSAHFNLARVPKQQLLLSSKQRRQLERGDTVLARGARLGQQEWISAYAPWGNTKDALNLGPIHFFQAYPFWLLLSAVISSLSLIALAVWLILNKLRKRLFKIQKTVDSIGSSYYDSAQIIVTNDAINALNSKILSMRNRIERLLDDQAYMIRAVSHDLRTPIAKLHFRLENISMLLPQQPLLVEQCKQDISNLNQLIDELLTYESLTTKADICLQPLDLYPTLLGEVEDLQAMQPQLHCSVEAKEIVSIDIAGNLPLLKRLFSNLLTNASKYANSTIAITVSQSTHYWHINVEDDGPGFTADIIDQVFKPFFKADSARTAQAGKGGYGLGLAISKQIARQHNGDIEVVNSVSGACLLVTIPVLACAQECR